MSAVLPIHHPAITQATDDDLDALLAIEERCFQHDRLNRRSLRAWLERPHGLVIVVRHHQRPVAYLLLIHREGRPRGRIYSLAVDPAWRGHGYARRLLTHAEELVAERGGNELRLEVVADNQAAISLYSAFGYRVIDTLSVYYENGSDGLRMAKMITQPSTPDA